MHARTMHHQPDMPGRQNRARSLVTTWWSPAALWQRFWRLGIPVRVAVATGTVIAAVACGLVVSFLWPRTATFGYGGQTCITNPIILPDMFSQRYGSTFTAQPKHTLSVAGMQLYAHTTCITAISAPRPRAVERITLHTPGLGWIRQTIHVTAAAPPTVNFSAPLSEPIATGKPLVFPLGGADQVFTYRLAGNDRTANCTAQDTQLACDTSQLQLDQSATYTLSLQRLFNKQVHSTLFTQNVTTVGAVTLTGSTITDGQTVYDKPSEVTLTFNKKVDAHDKVQLWMLPADGDPKQQDIAVTSTDNQLRIAFKQELPRSAKFELKIGSITAPDGGRLPEPIILSFNTSGGPKVQSVNIGSYRVAGSRNITVTFDAAIADSQKLSDYIRLESGGKSVATTITRSGRVVTINPVYDLSRCQRFTVRVLDGLQNEYGIGGGSAWSHNSRVTCHSTFSIGKSVYNRSITAYKFGSGSSIVVYAGNLHGDEKSANATLQAWIDYLERRYDDIPGGRTIVVIPNLNPDGHAANTRTNANNVDLNRNFPANNWKQAVTMPGGSFNPNGGGSSPLSEPESAAFADYIDDANPRLVLTYHSVAGIVQPNGAGDSDSLAKIYDQKSNLSYSHASAGSEIFAYDTTGSFEDWANEDHDTPVLLIELWTRSSNEFGRNQNAMWHMATL